ncbi:succinyl-diaminopimelate desuccinylase [Acuticoccus sediminis]|uniref:succinyl-diaminopimelate desuccinylase n=1 Tax=Acuticoccus sediminis TaxID=2184697 RepID=UPI001CFF2EEE|nr:succinyl-diaminopimelate desuccinylase [Acuticoccus sediminis]
MADRPEFPSNAHGLDPLDLAQRLIRTESVTPAGPAVFDIVEDALQAAGFAVTRMTFDSAGTPVENLFATRGSGKHLAFAGHVDVVPPGSAEAWTHAPFSAAIEGDTLYGRGSQDMKGAVAAMIVAATDWAASGAPGQVSFVITGDEEGAAVDGTAPLIAWAAERGGIDACIVGEPTSRVRLGDTIKIGRRGSMSAAVTVTGRQGHVAYQHLATSPVPELVAIAQRLLEPLDEGTAQFAPSNLEIVSIDIANPAWNVIPEAGTLRFNVRFNDLWPPETLRAELLKRIGGGGEGLAVDVAWQPSHGGAFRTKDDALIAAVTGAVEATTGVTPEATTGGGTSDARFIKDYCPVVEFGAIGDTMHQVDERTSVSELATLTRAYRAIIDAVLTA